MPQTQFQKATDLSRLNWKGWLLLLIAIAAMMGGIIWPLLPGLGSYSPSNRREGKFVALLMAFAAFGVFITAVNILRKFGISIYKDGQDPFDDLDERGAPRISARLNVTAETEDSESAISEAVPCESGLQEELAENLGSPVQLDDIL